MRSRPAALRCGDPAQVRVPSKHARRCGKVGRRSQTRRGAPARSRRCDVCSRRCLGPFAPSRDIYLAPLQIGVGTAMGHYVYGLRGWMEASRPMPSSSARPFGGTGPLWCGRIGGSARALHHIAPRPPRGLFEGSGLGWVRGRCKVQCPFLGPFKHRTAPSLVASRSGRARLDRLATSRLGSGADGAKSMSCRSNPTLEPTRSGGPSGDARSRLPPSVGRRRLARHPKSTAPAWLPSWACGAILVLALRLCCWPASREVALAAVRFDLPMRATPDWQRERYAGAAVAWRARADASLDSRGCCWRACSSCTCSAGGVACAAGETHSAPLNGAAFHGPHRHQRSAMIGPHWPDAGRH